MSNFDDKFDINDENNEVDKVGYCNPPEKSRFKKGVSGNPKGRKKKTPSKTPYEAVSKAFSEKTEVSENGKKIKITLLDLAMKQLARKCAKGDLSAFKELRFFAKYIEIKEEVKPEKEPTLIEETIRKTIGDVILRRLDELHGVLDEKYPDEDSIIERNYFGYREKDIIKRYEGYYNSKNP
ncbi:MAG: DUF5681 domain-containing protein [Candidatus Gastranaerophilales bacterium]|nr:DUF5681 domain-containing protein [Candidatus Gastranaerophilales bacterium]